YFALRGALDIGQLVAVIAAYRDLPPPVKELIDWDQQRLDVEVKYHQILEQFSAAVPRREAAVALPSPFAGQLEIDGVKLKAAGAETVPAGVNLPLPLGAATALIGAAGDGAHALCEILGRRISAYAGSVRIAGHDLATLPAAEAGARIAYFGQDSV